MRSDDDGGHLVKVGFFFWTARCLEFGPLDLGTDHLFAEIGSPTKKEFVVVTTTVTTTSQSLKPIQVQLSLKGSELGLSEVPWHDDICKLLRLVNHKATSMGLPRDDMGKAIDFDLIQYAVEFEREANRNSTSAAVIRFFFLGVRIVSMIMVVMMNKMSFLILGC